LETRGCRHSFEYSLCCFRNHILVNRRTMYTYDLQNSTVVEDAAPAAMPKRLAERLAELSKERPTKDELVANMKRASGNRDAFLESKVDKAAGFAHRAKKVQEVHAEYASNFTLLHPGTSAKPSLPPHLAKRAQQLREKGFKSPEILAKQMEIAHKKRQAKLEERKAKAAEGGIRAAKVRTAKEAFGENFELMSGHSRCQPPVKMPKHLAKRLATLTKARRSKEEIDAKHAEATARRAAALNARQHKAITLAGSVAKSASTDDLEHIEIIPSSTATATLPEHLAKRAETLSRGRETADEIQKKMEDAETKRQAILMHKASVAQETISKGVTVRATKSKYNENIELITSGSNARPPLPAALSNRAKSLARGRESAEEIQKKLEIAGEKRKAILLQKANVAQKTINKGQRVRAVKSEFSENIAILGNSRAPPAPLPAKLQQRADALRQKRESKDEILKKQDAASKKREAFLAQRVAGAKRPSKGTAMSQFQSPLPDRCDRSSATAAAASAEGGESKQEEKASGWSLMGIGRALLNSI